MALLLVTPADALPAFLRDAAATPFVFGESDCAMTLANWVRWLTGQDPAPDLRGAYASERGWRRQVIKAGGLDRLVESLAARAGMTATATPATGDIAVVETGVGPAGAIRSGSGWVVKSNRGLTSGRFHSLGIWTF